jgi:hypothetical protein
MTAKVTAEKALSKVQRRAERIRNDEIAVVGTVSKGDVVRQGDLYLVALGAEMQIALRPTSDRQLAPGSTQGSRHVLDGPCEVFSASPADVLPLIVAALAPAKTELYAELVGPVFRTLGETTVTHPEHGDRVLPAGECFAVVYQRQHAQQVRRTQD